MTLLNLPAFAPKLRKSNGKIYIFDTIRRKFVRLTPEEWVRQHFVNYLVLSQYPKNLFQVERGLKYNQRQKRSDILVLDRDAQPFLLVECKSTRIQINRQTFEQISIYNHTIQAKYLALTNGLQHFYAQVDIQKQELCFLEDLPHFPDN